MGSGAGSECSHPRQPYETEMGGLLKPQGLPPVTHLLLQGQTVPPTGVRVFKQMSLWGTF